MHGLIRNFCLLLYGLLLNLSVLARLALNIVTLVIEVSTSTLGLFRGGGSVSSAIRINYTNLWIPELKCVPDITNCLKL